MGFAPRHSTHSRTCRWRPATSRSARAGTPRRGTVRMGEAGVTVAWMPPRLALTATFQTLTSSLRVWLTSVPDARAVVARLLGADHRRPAAVAGGSDGGDRGRRLPSERAGSRTGWAGSAVRPLNSTSLPTGTTAGGSGVERHPADVDLAADARMDRAVVLVRPDAVESEREMARRRRCRRSRRAPCRR